MSLLQEKCFYEGMLLSKFIPASLLQSEQEENTGKHKERKRKGGGKGGNSEHLIILKAP